MPYAAPSLRACGCVVPSGQRCQHMIARDQERKARHDQYRPTASQRGYGGKWRQAREQYLKAHPHCAQCGNPATVVHHVIPHKGDKRLFWDRKNWSPACQHCHDGPLQSRERRS